MSGAASNLYLTLPLLTLVAVAFVNTLRHHRRRNGRNQPRCDGTDAGRLAPDIFIPDVEWEWPS